MSDESTLTNPWPKRVIPRRGGALAGKPAKLKPPLAEQVKAMLGRKPKVGIDIRTELTQLRKLLAEAPAAEHDAARDVAKAFRKGEFFTRVATSFLFPSERAWVQADLRDYRAEQKKASKGGGPKMIWAINHLRILLASLASFDDFLTMKGVKVLPADPDKDPVSRHDVFLGRAPSYLPTMLDVMGSEMLPLLLHWHDCATHADLGRAIAAIPTDEAMIALVDRADDKHSMAGLSEAVAAFPARAARILGERVVSKGKNAKLVAPMIPKGVTPAAATKDAPSAKVEKAAKGARRS